MPRDAVLIGRIIGAHGVRGEVKLRSFTAEPAAIGDYSRLQTAAGSAVKILKLRPGTNGFLATLEGVRNRDDAEALKGTELFVPRKLLEELPGDQVYLGDLVGMGVWMKGKLLGTVAGIANYGAGDLLDVKVEGLKDTVLIPFSEKFVVSTDLEGGTIVVDLPEGFMDNLPVNEA